MLLLPISNKNKHTKWIKKRANDGGKDWSFTRIDKHIRKPINAKLQTELKCKYRNRFSQNYEMRTTKLKRKRKKKEQRRGSVLPFATKLHCTHLRWISSAHWFSHTVSLSLSSVFGGIVQKRRSSSCPLESSKSSVLLGISTVAVLKSPWASPFTSFTVLTFLTLVFICSSKYFTNQQNIIEW